MYAISNFSTTGNGHAIPQPRRQRVLVRPWGFSELETAGLLADLPDLDGRLQWGQDTKAMARPDLVIHLVDATRLSGVFGGARWNAMGPVDAMHKAFRRGASEVALVLGSTHHLPHRRHGCWILAGANSLAASLDIVVRTMIEPLLLAPGERTWSIHDLAATHTLCTLSRERALERDTLARRLTAAVATALNFSHVAPARIAVAAEAHVLDDVVSLNPMMRDRMRLFRRRPSVSDLSAEVIVAYPWPTGLLEDTDFR